MAAFSTRASNLISRLFFEQVKEGRFRLVTSPVVAQEISRGPQRVQEWFEEYDLLAEGVEVDDHAFRLHQAYLRAGIVGPRRADDALHDALATVSRCAMIVSWNFRHIVHSEKMPLYNAVNALEGFGALAIHSPSEVVQYEEEV